MPARPEIKPTHKLIKDYYAALAAYAKQRVKHETALRSAFQNLLAEIGRKVGWTLIPELSAASAPSPSKGEGRGEGGVAPRVPAGRSADTARARIPSRTHAAGESLPLSASRTRPDGTFRDDFYIERGHWEAKDTDDDLDAEIKKKIKKGYPLTNIIFEDTREARLYQNGKHEGTYDLQKPQALCDLLTAFFSHTEPAHDNFEKAVDEFKQRVPDLARGLVALIAESHKTNPRFIEAFNHHDNLKQLDCSNLAFEEIGRTLGPLRHALGVGNHPLVQKPTLFGLNSSRTFLTFHPSRHTLASWQRK